MTITTFCMAQTYVMQIILGNHIPGNSLISNYNGANGWSQIISFNHGTSNRLINFNQSAPQSGIIEVLKLYYPSTSNFISAKIHENALVSEVNIIGLISDPQGSGNLVPFIEYRFRNVLFGSFNKEVSNNENAQELIDKIAFRAGAMYVKHYIFDQFGNSTSIGTGWNFSNNTTWNGNGLPPF